MQRKYKAPPPPRQKVDYGDGQFGYEYNYADPDYKLAQDNHEKFIANRAGELAFDRATRIKLTAEQKKEVDAWKKDNPDLFDETDSDANIWIEDIAVSTDRDFEAFMEFLTGPIEEVVSSIQDGFQDKEQGS